MKFFGPLFAILLTVTLPFTAWAGGPSVEVGYVAGNPGDIVSVPFNLVGGDQDYSSYNLRFQLPVNTGVSGFSRGNLIQDSDFKNWLGCANILSGDFETMQTEPVIATDGIFQLLAYAGSATFTGTGVLDILDVSILPGAVEGIYDILFMPSDRSFLNQNALGLSADHSSINPTTVIGHLVIGNPDTDDDGLSDGWEAIYFGDLDIDGTGDADNDGLTDLEEYQQGTSPVLRDTDHDGMSDLWEILTVLIPSCQVTVEKMPMMMALPTCRSFLPVLTPTTMTVSLFSPICRKVLSKLILRICRG